MTQEEINLLLEDLCARLPYGIKVQYENEIFDIDNISALYEEIKLDIANNYTISVLEIKPYLFPLSSMTEEQKQEYTYIVNYLSPDDTDNWKEGEFVYVDQMSELMHFFYKNHLDFRGLIKQDLALDATGLNVY